MVRETLISIYLVFFRIIFTFFKLFPQEKKTVCVVSFGDNVFYTARALKEVSNEDIIVLKDRQCNYPFDSTIDKVIPFDIRHPFAYFQSIYHLATASTVMVDNYFGFLAAVEFRSKTTCVQLWHAVGALKQFGLMEPSISKRSDRAIDRFKRVYSTFNYVTVGSEKMAEIFRQSFSLDPDRIVRTGIPRTDMFYNEMEKKRLQTDLAQKWPIIKNKKVILYAPTFRSEELNHFQIQLDIEQMYRELGEEYVLFIKNHPAVTYNLDQKFSSFVVDVSNYYDANHILLLTDILISDYSSIPCEYALLDKPMIFYAYDLQSYKKKSGLLPNFEQEIPGPIVQNTDDIIHWIKNQKFDQAAIKRFANMWNRYSKGASSMNVATLIHSDTESQSVAR
ncbi:CDP-glycerol glycerophosphotransferase family protein [Lentibacillus saliphilus]|uniref:CDP-glycerol glycerophosphotransferase family protein n=1 Tax=Lentibacillus saliphilus TaxID=2737028 RepID=UPI001C30D1D8|nr:CDP-glycerol glycerophosphotransferase family protein [Lentibacillus saliphilus]